MPLIIPIGHENITKLLIANAANVNAKDVFENTPLHSSARNGNFFNCPEISGCEL